MNAVERYIAAIGESEAAVMNELTARGAISDLCVRAADVAEVDGQFVAARLFPPREFAMTRHGEWVTDPYPPGTRSLPQVEWYGPRPGEEKNNRAEAQRTQR